MNREKLDIEPIDTPTTPFERKLRRSPVFILCVLVAALSAGYFGGKDLMHEFLPAKKTVDDTAAQVSAMAADFSQFKSEVNQHYDGQIEDEKKVAVMSEEIDQMYDWMKQQRAASYTQPQPMAKP